MSGSEALPLLGEPFAVELANSLYGLAGERRDVIATAHELRTWFAHAPEAGGIAVPREMGGSTVSRCREVRDATRSLLGAAADGGSPDAAAVTALNDVAAAAPARVVLVRGGGWRVEHSGPHHQRFVATVASRCVLFLGGPDLAHVRRCAGPGCSVLFVARHRNRRFCHESCSHGARQARYHRSSRGGAR